jgi:shikimate dehydrogenase
VNAPEATGAARPAAPQQAGVRRAISGSTRLAAVIGDPVRHSLSPAIHNAAFRACGLDWVFVALPVAAGDVNRALDGMRAFGIDGLSVTMPHKQAVAAAVDELDADAAALDAVNCVWRKDDRLGGANTDGPGFVASLADAGFSPAGRRCVVLGAGGAARAVVLALGRAGAAEVTVVNRTPERAEAAAALVGDIGRVASVEAVEEADLIVNATSVGMGTTDPGQGQLPLPGALVRPDLVVADLVVHPLDTPLLRHARSVGATSVDGAGMLVHQAALAFERWTGAPAPVDVMLGAVRQGLQA